MRHYDTEKLTPIAIRGTAAVPTFLPIPSLLHLADIAPGAGLGHQIDRVQVRLSLVGIDWDFLVVDWIAPV